ncbi:MAG: WD40 repeat domain-containing protein, partial [Omnitrophica WOR_2 bacterium]
RWWQPGGGQAQGLPLQSNPEFDLPALDNGLYVLQVSARWRGPGDVTYGFLIQVGPQGATPVPFSSATAAATQPAPSETSYPSLSPMTRIGKGVIKSFALSPDGRWVAVSTPLGVYQYHAVTWEQAWFSPSGANAASLAFSHNSQRLALSTAAGEMELLDAETGELSARMSNAGDNFAWSPDDSRLVSGGGCHTVTVWDANSAEKVKELLGNQCSEGYSGIKVAWSSDGKRIYAALPGKQSRLWDAQTLQPLDSFQLETPPDMMAPVLIPSPSDDILVLFDWMSSSTITILDGTTGKWLYALDGPANATITTVAWSPDGKRIAVGYGAINETRVWDTTSRQVVQTIKRFSPYAGLSWLPDGQALFGLMDAAGGLYTVDVKTSKGLSSLEGHAPVAAYLAWTADGLVTYGGRNLAWGEIPGSQPIEPQDLTWWDVQTGQPRQGVQTGGDASHLFRPDLKSPDGARWVNGDQTMDIQSKQVVARLEGTSSEQRSHDLGAWSPDGKSVASADSLFTQPVVIWDPVTGKPLQTLPANTGKAQPFLGSLAWSPDSRWLAGGGSLMDPASGSHDGMILVWDAATGAQVQLLTSAMFQDRVQVIAWSPDGKRLAAGLSSGQIVTWDMTAFTPSAVLQGHAGVVSGLAWSPDGSRLASSAEDGTMLIWKLN